MSRTALRAAMSVAAMALLLLGLRASSAGWDLDWTRLSDGTTTSFLGTPAFVATGPARLEVWGWGSDGAVWGRTFDGLAWSNWSSTEGPPGGAASAPGLTFRGSGITDMVIKGKSGAIYHRYRTGETKWSAWESLGGASPDGPAITADQNRGRVDIWLRGGDGNLWHRQWAGSSWAPWHMSGGSPPGGLQSAPAVVVRGDIVDVVVRGTGGKLWHRAWNAAKSEWSSTPGRDSGWEPLAGATSTAPSVSAFWSNQLHVWARGLGADGNIYHNFHLQGRWSELVSEGAPALGTTSVAALHWGSPSQIRIALGVRSGDSFFYRGWEEKMPAPTVSGGLDRIVSLASGNSAVWENTALVVPPGRTGAGPGSVLFSIGCTGTIWRGNYSTFFQPTAGGPIAGSPTATVTSQALAPLIPANVTLVNPHSLGSCDNIITHLPDGSLMLMRQAVITGSPNGGASHQKTGGEVVFISKDGGTTWEYRSVIDPFDPAFANGRYGKKKEQGGLDRPELHVPPRGDRVYMSTHGLGDQVGNGLIFASTAPFGTRWTLVESSLPYTAPYMMTATRDRLYIFNLQDGLPDNYDAVLRWYDLPRDGTAAIKANGPFMIAAKDGFSFLKEIDGKGAAIVGDGSVSITVAGRYGDETFLRVAYPHVEKVPVLRNVLRIHLVRVAGNRASLVPEGSLTMRAASTNGSILDLVASEPDYFGLPSELADRPILYYWKETEATPANGLPGDGWGNVVVRGRIVRGLSHWSEPFVLSRNADNTERRWNAHKRTGDYNRGAFFYEPPRGDNVGKLRFFAQWIETPLKAGKWDWIMHTNVVTVDP